MNHVRRVDQLLAGFAEGDAISSEALLLQESFRRLGHTSDIFVPPGSVDSRVSSLCRPLAAYEAGKDDVVLYHYSIASVATEVFSCSQARRILLYHNITPAEWFQSFDDQVAADLRRAREELKQVVNLSDAVWADSAFNALELRGLGEDRVEVFPLAFSSRALDLPTEQPVLQKFTRPMTNILFVGRIAPNKCVEELILAFWWYRKINPFSRLIIVGSDRSAPRYFTMLRMLAGEMHLPNVCCELFASPAGLATYYSLSDVFVTTSRHEGYCLPLVEAMYKGIPVIARATGGMPEAMDGAGVLFDEMTPIELAELIHRVLSDSLLREEIIASQKRRISALLARNVDQELAELLSRLPLRK